MYKYCIVLYCIVLYCIVLYCIVLYCIVLYCIVLYCIVHALELKLPIAVRSVFYVYKWYYFGYSKMEKGLDLLYILILFIVWPFMNTSKSVCELVYKPEARVK